jgi:putative transposase
VYHSVMVRSLRMDYPDTFYHVLARGNEKRNIFYDEQDYLKFLDTLAKMVERFKLEVHAYVLMQNHYHLLLHTKEANLSRAIHWLGVSYTVWFNRRHKRSGHLFQGRFKSFLIEDNRYLTMMCFYIHGNPIRAGLGRKLRDYRWSSYRAYGDKKNEPPWLTTGLVLEVYGGSRKRFLRAQEMFFKEGENILGELRYGLYLGSEEFSEVCMEKLRREGYRERPQVRSLLRRRDIRELAVKILERLGERDPESVFNVHKYKFQSRDLGIYILYQFGVYRNEEIGRVFGVGYTAIPGAVRRGRGYLERNSQLEKKVSKIIDDI